MSANKCCEAKLKDFSGPFFTEMTEKFQERYYGEGGGLYPRTKVQISEALARQEGMDLLKRAIVTLDGYVWEHGIQVTVGEDKEKVLLLFPRSQTCLEGFKVNRHMAIYTSTSVNRAHIDVAMSMVIEAFLSWMMEELKKEDERIKKDCERYKEDILKTLLKKVK